MDCMVLQIISQPLSPVAFRDEDSSPLAASTPPPPVEIPPKKRNMIQSDRLSISLDDSREDLMKEMKSNYLDPQISSVLPPRVPERSSSRDRRPNNWQGRPVHLWTTTQVGQWLMVLGLEQYIKSFQAHEITGIHLLNLDSTKLKDHPYQVHQFLRYSHHQHRTSNNFPFDVIVGCSKINEKVAIGVNSSSDRSVIKKKKIKGDESCVEKERKAHEKEQKALEKLQKKAEKARRK
ncbi:neurabin-2 [Caerostris extrusa]|uniref:Neurabin-2 n=1 Tax=Caerostris extrusa TaxID=172846 RepID=A0AAV4T5Z4_CAEEX|nr:neurabin-2 [Caerostris extrusa]